MEELKSLELSALVDLLAKHTADHTSKLKDGIKDWDYEQSKVIIKAIMTEIESRKQTPANTNTTDPNLNLDDHSYQVKSDSEE